MKLKMFVLFGLCSALAGPVQAITYFQYVYKFIVRDAIGFAFDDGKVSEHYSFEVYDKDNNLIGSAVYDNDLATDGYNCRLFVNVGTGPGNAQAGSPLTLVVNYDDEGISYRSSKVLPPLGPGGVISPITKTAVGVFYVDPTDSDGAYDSWRMAIGSSISYPWTDIGGVNADYDGDGYTNGQEYQRGTDPAGGAVGLHDKTDFSIKEANGGYEVSFNYDWSHVYSIRMIEGDTVVGRDGLDLEMFMGKGGTSCGTFFGDFSNENYSSGRLTRYVEKPAATGKYCIGLAIDGLLVDYITVESAPSNVPVTPGSPIAYDTEDEAKAALARAVLTPSEKVSEVLTTDAAKTRYAGMFSIGVSPVDEKWQLAAVLTADAVTNLSLTVSNATVQIDVKSLAQLPANVTTNVCVVGCEPGFYYTLYDGATVTNLTADANVENCNVLCGENGRVVFPTVKKPSESAGFFSVGAQESPSAQPGDRRRR